MKKLIASAALSAAAASASAFGITPADQFGSVAAPAVADRVIDLDDHTSAIRVRHGEAVTVRKNGKSVTWYFDGIAPSFKLSRILPDVQGADGRDVQIYIEPEVLS
ncbi:MAG: CzcE family metal-binding protein [Massilia sp.]